MTETLRYFGISDGYFRQPNWVSSLSVPITVNGSAAQPGQPGSYVHVVMTPWPKGATTIRFELPMAVQAHRYGGADQFPGAQTDPRHVASLGDLFGLDPLISISLRLS